MLERIVELLVGLAVAAAAAFGIETATTTPHGVGPDTDSIAAKVAEAKQRATERRADAASVELTSGEVGAQSSDAGLAAAIAALERVMESAPDAASDGLQQAWDSVSNAGPPEDPGSAADAAPVDVPAGPPAETPAGPPAGVPPVDTGRP
jgi:hypothetical protein